MRSIVLIIWLLTFNITKSTAQQMGVFNYGNVNDSFTHASDGLIDNEGNHIIPTLHDNSQVRISFFDSNNILQWSKAIETSTNGNIGRIIQLTNLNYVAILTSDVNFKAHIICFDKYSNILWHKQVGTTIGSTLVNLVETSDQNIVYTGTVGATSVVFCTDTTGTILWGNKVAYSSPYSTTIADVVPTDGGNLMMFTDVFNNAPGSDRKVMITKLDNSGNIIFNKVHKYENEFNLMKSAIQHSNGSFYTTGLGINSTSFDLLISDVMVQNFDGNGNYISHKRYGLPFMDIGSDLQEDEYGDLIIIGQTKPQEFCFGNVLVLKIYEDLDTVFTKIYGNSSGTGAYFSLLHKKGPLFYTFGYGSLWSGSFNNDAHLIKTDLNFELLCNKLDQGLNLFLPEPKSNDSSMIVYTAFAVNFIDVAFDSVTSLSMEPICPGAYLGEIGQFYQSELHVYPVPADDFVFLHLANGDLLDGSVRIIDLSGKTCLETSAQGYEAMINVSHLRPGLYMVQMMTNMGAIKKMISVQ